ncbi:MAG: hypothetical protein J2P36_31050 [Ktedonobacteraceae bacterium]|nr:hypothetical protein [Ktedonobacteraceae bacterium]
MKTATELQTIAVAYREICEGQDPWIPLGNFMNDFFGNFPGQREELLQAPVEEPANPTLEQHRWALFCAASVEYLCVKYGLACPTWALSPTATDPLVEPWYHGLAAHKPHVQERLRRDAPEPFAKRNIFCSRRVFLNKYERPAGDLLPRRRSA